MKERKIDAQLAGRIERSDGLGGIRGEQSDGVAFFDARIEDRLAHPLNAVKQSLVGNRVSFIENRRLIRE